MSLGIVASAGGPQALASVLTAMARDGRGVAWSALSLVEGDLASGRLVRVLPGWRSERPLHILYAPDRRITPKIRSFLDFAAVRFGPI